MTKEKGKSRSVRDDLSPSQDKRGRCQPSTRYHKTHLGLPQ